MKNSPDIVSDNSIVLSQAIQKLVPWIIDSNENILKTQTEKDIKNLLNSYYLFPINEISISSNCDDIPSFINERFQTILSAAYKSGLSVLLLISSRNGKNKIYLGFRNVSSSKSDPAQFEAIINGIFPGKNIKFEKTANISSSMDGYNYGGIITGIPVLKKDDEKQRFNLASIIRSLYGKDYALVIISNPIPENEIQKSFNELIRIRDILHSFKKITIGKEKGESSSISESESNTKGSSKTQGHNKGSTTGFGIPTPFGFIGGGRNYSRNSSNTESESTTFGKTVTISEQQSQSISIEQQNGFAREFEKIANRYIERMIQGFNAGYWETSITFASKQEITSKILAGTFIGELSKSHNKLLPPPRMYLDRLEEGQALFLPKISSTNPIFPKSLASYITSEELSLISAPPTQSVPGYEIKRTPDLALNDVYSEDGLILGNIADHGNPIKNNFFYLSTNDLNKHLFVCGLTGSGKTTTVKHILKNLAQKENIPFLVLESAKRDYRQLLADDVFKDNLNIFTIGDATTSPIRFNPFYIQKGVHPIVHIDYLKAIFNASFSLYGPMPSIVEKCLHNVYIKKGWDLTTGKHPNFVNSRNEYEEDAYKSPEHYYCFPTLNDLKDEIESYISSKLDYKGELRDNIRTAIIVRLESMCIGAKGLMFNTYDFYPLEKLLSSNIIFEMENLADDDDKAFFVGLILVLISEHRQKENPSVNPGLGNKGMRHFLVIEEAHRLLKNIETERTTEMLGNPKGKAVEVFCNVISEMRSLGQGVAVVEQIPSKIALDVIKNSNTKIVHRLVSKDDQSLLAGSLSINDKDALYLNRLNTGHALCHKEGMERPVECVVLNDVKTYAISDEKIKRLMNSLTNLMLHNYKTYELDSLLGKEGRALVVKTFNSMVLNRQERDLKDLKIVMKKEMQKLLYKKGIHNFYKESIFEEYFTLQVMKLINSGIYCRHNRIPDNFKSLLYKVIKTPSIETQKKLLSKLNDLWQPAKAGEFVMEVVENLSINHLLKNEFDEITFYSVSKIISSFFLMPNQKIINAVTKNVLNQFGENA